jgi:HflC protein
MGCSARGFLIFSGMTFVAPKTDYVILTQFGKPVGQPIDKAGLHFKLPWIQEMHRLEKRVLEWDGPSAEMPTKDKLSIVLDSFGRWRIKDPPAYFLRLRDERSARSRLDDILGSETRNTVARHALVELIRTTKERKAILDEAIVNASGTAAAGLPPIQIGRVGLEEEIAEQSRAKLAEFGIELLDVRFKRINYNQAVRSKIFDRVVSERRQIAVCFRSEGAGEAARTIFRDRQGRGRTVGRPGPPHRSLAVAGCQLEEVTGGIEESAQEKVICSGNGTRVATTHAEVSLGVSGFFSPLRSFAAFQQLFPRSVLDEFRLALTHEGNTARRAKKNLGTGGCHRGREHQNLPCNHSCPMLAVGGEAADGRAAVIDDMLRGANLLGVRKPLRCETRGDFLGKIFGGNGRRGCERPADRKQKGPD